MSGAALLLVVLAAGLASQWVAWRIGLPAIVVLIATGLVLGPGTGLIQLGFGSHELTELIGLGVAIILFEGGMDLKLAEFRRVGHGIGRLTLLGPPVAWLLGTWAAHDIAGLSWGVSAVLGAILVVTGPTVIIPLLRQARLNKDPASLLKWEGIVNDPLGVLLAVLTFQYLTIGGGWVATLTGLLVAVVVAGVLGGAGGWGVGWLFRRGAVPEHLKAPVLVVMVLCVYWVSNLAQHEAGLLSVTVMGLVFGNLRLVERETLQRFKEQLTVVLLSVLFIVIPSQLQAQQLALLDWRVLAFIAAVLLLVRPVSIALATAGAPMRWQEKALLAWIAPRGIVAVATAGLFGPALVEAGFADASRLLPITFAVVIVTVLAHGLTLGPLARRLGLAARRSNGLLIVGATDWTLAFARALADLRIEVLVVDGAYQRLKAARMAGIPVHYGEILSEHTEHTLEVLHLDSLLCATENDFYNALVCKALGPRFGHHRTFQTALPKGAGEELRQLTVQQRGYLAFDAQADHATLHERLSQGWRIQSTKLSASFDWDALAGRLGEPWKDWQLLGAVEPGGSFRLYSKEQRFRLDAGWTAIYFAPEADRRPAVADSGQARADAASGTAAKIPQGSKEPTP
ncbi:cation:proton antiporter [Ramlibacter rhizophilus]|uniref:Sodium:proton antiporter n=1 Tax=Ramlibacter rhizophilus TaxID=1781167 RepID=A0A4Z0BDA0_9BURK|nr:sodium:proton antiporter [Ramlibacter rhizophilus]TFY97242.1 sodium:proton antiporter [Ramlibacter rhizophilus]